MTNPNDDFEVVRGSGNVFRDLGRPDADVQQTKAILAARIIGILEDEGLSTRKAQERTGINHADFTRIRNAQLGRFTIDRLMTVLNKLGQQVKVQVSLHPRPTAIDTQPGTSGPQTARPHSDCRAGGNGTEVPFANRRDTSCQ